MNTSLNPHFTFTLLSCLKPGQMFRTPFGVYMVLDLEPDDQRRVGAVNNWGRVEWMDPTTHVVATQGTWVEEGAEDRCSVCREQEKVPGGE